MGSRVTAGTAFAHAATAAGAAFNNAPAVRWAHLRVSLVYWWRHGRWPALDAPLRFTEWVQWRKLNDRSLARARLTDKLHSKALAAARLGARRVVPTLWSGDRLPERLPAAFPFIVKANHGCGQFAVVRSDADYREAQRLAPRWLERPYGALLDEWHYGAARRTLIVEPFLGGAGAGLPLDYKVYVFGGRAEIVQLHQGRGDRHRWTQFDRAWRPLSRDPIDVPAPAGLGEMLDAAECLAAGEDFLRVDFYDVGGAVYFGEFCLFPGSGLDPFRPDGLDVALGACWSAARSRASRALAFPAPAGEKPPLRR